MFMQVFWLVMTMMMIWMILMRRRTKMMLKVSIFFFADFLLEIG